MSWKKRTVLGFVALSAVVFLFLVVEHVRGKWGVSRWKARMQAKGEAVTTSTVPLPPLPADQNGMPALMAAAGQMPSLSGGLRPPAAMYAVPNKVIVITREPFWPDRTGRMNTNITWEMVGGALGRHEPALKQAIEALEYTKFRMRLNYDEGWSMRLPHLVQLRRLGYVLAAAALYNFRQGECDEGTIRLEGVIRLIGVLEEEPISISQMVRMGIAENAFTHTWQAAHGVGITDDHLKRLQQAWAEQNLLRGMRRASCIEHAAASREFERFRDGGADIGDWLDDSGPARPVNSPSDLLENMIYRTPVILQKGIYAPIWLFAWSHQDQLRFLETVERGLNLWDAAIQAQSVIPLRAIGNREYRPLMDRTAGAGENPYDRMRYILSPRADGFYPSMIRAFKTQTLRELALAGIALRRFELRFGKSARQLEELVPEFLPTLPHDFMSGRPLTYLSSTNGPLLYSVGVDGEDNGGDVGPRVGRGFSILDGRDFVWPLAASPEEAAARFQSDR